MQDRLYRSSKICISDQQYPQSIGYVSNRLLQALRAGSFVLQQKIQESERWLKLIPGKHYIEWNDARELPDLIHYWLGKEEERMRIVKAGREAVIREHSFDKRVEEFRNFLRRLQ
jgi:spore maturation protein CgeB